MVKTPEDKGQSFVVVARYWDPEEAICAQGFLQSRGISSHLADQYHLGVQPHLRFALGGYRLFVSALEAEDVARLLADPLADAAAPEAEAVAPTDDPLGHRPHMNLPWLLFAGFVGWYAFVPRLKGHLQIALQTIVLLFFFALIWFVVSPEFAG